MFYAQDSESGSIFRSQSNIKASGSPNSTKAKGTQRTPCPGPVSVAQREQGGGRLKNEFVKPIGSQDGENAPFERQVSPDKLYRATLLRSRLADTILKAREKALDQGEKNDPEKLRREREELERQQREERARLQAEAKAAEDARRRAEEETAVEAKRKRELEREAADKLCCRTAELMFENYKVPALFVAKNAVLTSFASGRATSLVVDSGGGSTTVVPVQNGYVLQKVVATSPIGGEFLTECMMKSLESKGIIPRYSFKRKEVRPGDFQILIFQIPRKVTSCTLRK